MVLSAGLQASTKPKSRAPRGFFSPGSYFLTQRRKGTEDAKFIYNYLAANNAKAANLFNGFINMKYSCDIRVFRGK